MQDLTYKVPQKKAPLKEKPYKNKEYLSWLHNQGLICMVCGAQQIELHHLRTKGQVGRIDNQCVPLCSVCHRTGNFSAHGSDAKAFNKEWKDKLLEEAERLFKKYTEEEIV